MDGIVTFFVENNKCFLHFTINLQNFASQPDNGFTLTAISVPQFSKGKASPCFLVGVESPLRFELRVSY